MLQNVPLLLDITREVVKAVNTPVTVKTRLGWNQEQLIITSLAEQLQDCGIQALTIHGRTRSQMYTGEADWTLIGEVKRNPRIHIPIIGNGDITTPEQARQAFLRYGVDAIMVGRASFGRPWIFKEISDYLDACDRQPSDSNGASPNQTDSEGASSQRHRLRDSMTVSDKLDILIEHRRIPRHPAHATPSGGHTHLQGNPRFPSDTHRHAPRQHPRRAPPHPRGLSAAPVILFPRKQSGGFSRARLIETTQLQDH